MQTEKFTPDVAVAISDIQSARVQEIVRELSMYNLGVTVPHIHQDGVARLLPENRIQYEKDLQVSFPEKQKFFSDRHDGFAVGWRWNETDGRVEAYAWCHDDE